MNPSIDSASKKIISARTRIIKNDHRFDWLRSLLQKSKFMGLTLFLLIIICPSLQAFEAHVVNVTATIIQIDPPLITPPGSDWSDPEGGMDLIGPVDVSLMDNDVDATHIYFTTGTDPLSLADPECGGALGGIKSSVPSVTISTDTVIKATACDGDTVSAHHSPINIKIYTFAVPKDINKEQSTLETESVVLDSPESENNFTTPTSNLDIIDNEPPPTDQTNPETNSDSSPATNDASQTTELDSL